MRPSHLDISKLDLSEDIRLDKLCSEIIFRLKTVTCLLREGDNINQLDNLKKINKIYLIGKPKNILKLCQRAEWETVEIIHSFSSDMRQIIEDIFLNIQIKIEEINSLIDNGIHINTKEFLSGDSMLHICLQNYYRIRNKDILLSFLIEKGANINATNKKNKTPLHFLLEQSRSKSKYPAMFLIEKGADTNIKDENGQTSFDLIFFGKNQDLFCYFLKYCEKNKLEMLKKFINNESNSRSLLLNWVRRKELGTVQILLSYYAKNKLEILKKLIINSKIFEGNSLLHWVCINVYWEERKLVLHWACTKTHSAVEMLKKKNYLNLSKEEHESIKCYLDLSVSEEIPKTTLLPCSLW